MADILTWVTGGFAVSNQVWGVIVFGAILFLCYFWVLLNKRRGSPRFAAVMFMTGPILAVSIIVLIILCITIPIVIIPVFITIIALVGRSFFLDFKEEASIMSPRGWVSRLGLLMTWILIGAVIVMCIAMPIVIIPVAAIVIILFILGCSFT